MKKYILFLLLLSTEMVSCNDQPNPKTDICKFKFPRHQYDDSTFCDEMKDGSWIIFQGNHETDNYHGYYRSISYYFVGESSSTTGWLYCDCGTMHFSDSCSAKTYFKKFMDHKEFK